MSGESSPEASVVAVAAWRCVIRICGFLTALASASAQVQSQGLVPVPGRPGAGRGVPLAPDVGRLPAEKRYMPSSISEPLMSA